MSRLTRAWNAFSSTVKQGAKYIGESQAFQTAKEFSAGATKRVGDSAAYRGAVGGAAYGASRGMDYAGGAIKNIKNDMRMAKGAYGRGRGISEAFGGTGFDAGMNTASAFAGSMHRRYGKRGGNMRMAGYGAAGLGAGGASADMLNPWGLGWND